MRHHTPVSSTSSSRQLDRHHSTTSKQSSPNSNESSTTVTTVGGGKKTPPKSPPGGTPRNSVTPANVASTSSGVFGTQSSLSLSAAGTTHHNDPHLNVSGVDLTESTSASLNASSRPGHHQQHGRNKQAHFVLDTIRLKKAAVLSADLCDAHVLDHDNVSNVCSINKEMAHDLLPAGSFTANSLQTLMASLTTNSTSSSSDALTTSVSASMHSPSKMASKIAKDKEEKMLKEAKAKAEKNMTTTFSEVNYASDPLGATIEVQSEIDHFFETGLPLVSSDQVPDADALIVVSAGPEAKTSSQMALAAVDGAAKYMAYRSLCVHISGCALFGNVDEMLSKKRKETETGHHHDHKEKDDNNNNKESQDPNAPIPLDEVAIADVSMVDLMEHGGGMRNFRPFSLSEPNDPFFDRYTPKHLQRLGMSNDDIEDKLAQVKILAEEQMVKQFPKAVGFMFFLDCIHFRDGFQRFTSDSHVTVSSQHAANSLFHSRTTVLATHVPALASAMAGHIPADNAEHQQVLLLQPWINCCRHLAAETHHVLNIVVSVPEDGSALGGSEDAEQVTDLNDLDFSTVGNKNNDDDGDGDGQGNKHRDPNQHKPEVREARRNAIAQLKSAFDVTAALHKATQAGARHHVHDHIFPKRTHLKLNEYVPQLKRLHDELTNDQKTRHSFAKSALQYLSTQVKGDDAVAAHMSGLGDNNREKFAAIFRAAFVKSKVQKEHQKRSESKASSGNNNKIDSRSQSNQGGGARGSSPLQQQQQQPSGAQNNNNFNMSNLNLTSLLQATGGASGAARGSSQLHDLSTQDIGKLRQQAEALLLIKERLEFDLSKSDKEVKKLRSELSTSQTKRKRLERELTDSQGQSLVAEANVQKLQTEQNTEVLELRQRLLNMQQQIDAFERKNQELNNTIRVNEEEFRRREKVLKEDTELQFRDLRADLEVAIAEKNVLQESLEEHTGRIHAVEELLVQVEVEKKSLNQQLADSRNAIEAAKAEARRAIDRASRMRKAEREEYLRLLESGRSCTEELVTFEDLRIDRVAATESLYRTGSDGVKNWLKAIALEQYAAVFHNAGFRDILSVANVTEQDLVSLKILAGHRRKIMAAVSELKSHLTVAISKRQMAPISHELADFETLVSRQREWYRDFSAVVRAEQANDDDEVFV